MMRDTRRTLGEGGGKLILFGEHAVVYGVPAVVASLGTGVTATAHFAKSVGLKLTDGRTGEVIARVGQGDSGRLAEAFERILDVLGVGVAVDVNATVHIPVGSGLGSSAALAVAIARALGTIADTDEDRVAAAVSASERVFHGEPSGIDETAALRGGLFQFRRTDDAPEVRPIPIEKLRLLVCLAEPGASTAEMVAGVRDFHDRYFALAEALDAAIAEVVSLGIIALEEDDLTALGAAMNANHGLLCSLGVSTPELNRACDIARRAGAFGAKLTGAGGGGCVFAVAPEDREESVLDAWKAAGYSTYVFDV